MYSLVSYCGDKSTARKKMFAFQSANSSAGDFDNFRSRVHARNYGVGPGGPGGPDSCPSQKSEGALLLGKCEAPVWK